MHIHFCLYSLKSAYTPQWQGVAGHTPKQCLCGHRLLARGLPLTPSVHLLRKCAPLGRRPSCRYVIKTLRFAPCFYPGHSPTAGKSPAYPIEKAAGRFFVKRSAAKRLMSKSKSQILYYKLGAFLLDDFFS